MKQRSWSAFSLIELTLALGIAALCLLAVMGLIPIAVQTNRNATSQTAANSIIGLRDRRYAGHNSSATSPQYGITFGTAENIIFDGAGQFTTLVRCQLAVPA